MVDTGFLSNEYGKIIDDLIDIGLFEPPRQEFVIISLGRMSKNIFHNFVLHQIDKCSISKSMV